MISESDVADVHIAPHTLKCADVLHSDKTQRAKRSDIDLA
ncbi:hypothetical protein ACEQPO_06925 [Bacillus sp. SL00103]